MASLLMNKVENSSEDKDKVLSIFKIIKGLSGKGVSFMVLKKWRRILFSKS